MYVDAELARGSALRCGLSLKEPDLLFAGVTQCVCGRVERWRGLRGWNSSSRSSRTPNAEQRTRKHTFWGVRDIAKNIAEQSAFCRKADCRRVADEVQEIGIEDARARIESREAAVLDVREPEEYSAGHLPGAISIPQAELATRLDEIPKDRDLVVACAGGLRSANCTAFLSQMGFSRAISLVGGTDGWRDAGLAIESDDG